MQRRVIIGSTAAAAVLSAGAATVLLTGASSDAGTPSAGRTTAAHAHRHHRGLLRHLAHGELTVKRHGSFVTLDVVRGTVTSVSSSFITVRAADATSETYVVTGDTTVVQRADHHRTDSTIGAVKTGDRVLVVGTGTTEKSAKRIADRGPAKTTSTS